MWPFETFADPNFTQYHQFGRFGPCLATLDLDLILYTYGNPSWTFKLDADSQDLLSNGFDVNKPTKVLSHGYTDNGPRFCSDFVQAYENDPNETFNIICIDWQILAKADEPEFSGAANNAIEVGKAVGEKVVAKMLIEGLGQNPDKVFFDICNSI